MVFLERETQKKKCLLTNSVSVGGSKGSNRRSKIRIKGGKGEKKKSHLCFFYPQSAGKTKLRLKMIGLGGAEQEVMIDTPAAKSTKG